MADLNINGSLNIVGNGILNGDEIAVKDNYHVQKKVYIPGGSSGYICVAKVPIYDSNVTINISCTNSKVTYGTVVFACQNFNAQYIAVCGDFDGSLRKSIRYVAPSSSNHLLEVYFITDNFSHIILDVNTDGAEDVPYDVGTIVDSIPENVYEIGLE